MKKKGVLLILLFCELIMLSFVFASSNSNVANGELSQQKYGNHYEKPKTEEDVVEVPSIKEKQWFEYVTYDMNNPQVTQVKLSKVMVNYPLDYSLASVMEITPLEMKPEIGSDALESTSDYSTASSVEVTYERSSGFQWGLSEELEFETKSVKINLGLFQIPLPSFKIKVGSSQEWQYNETVSITRTFEARNEIGEFKPWRVVQYKVLIPIYICVYDNNQLIHEFYYVCHIMSGLCRQWADGYVEHWSSGQKVRMEDFYGDYLTKEKLLELLKRPW